MKISEQPGKLLIDNSLAMPVATGIVLALGGLTIAALGMMNHIKWLFALAAALVVIGALVACFARATHIVLAKSGPSSIASKRLFSSPQTQTFALADAGSVQLVTTTTTHRSRGADGDTRVDTDVKSTIFLSLRTGTRIALGSKTRTLNIGGFIGALVQSMPLKKEAERIAAFVGVPLQACDSVSLGAARST